MSINNLPQCWADFQDVIASGTDRIILYGPPGTGKSYGGLTIGVEGNNAYRLVCTEEMTTATVEGMFLPSSDGTFQWKDGQASKAWRTGGRLVIDEIDKASSDVFAMLLAFTDSVGSAIHDLPNDDRIAPAKGFSVVMTTNLEDPDDLPQALRDRFPVAIEIAEAHPDALLPLPEELREVARGIVSAEPERRSSLRAFYEFARLRDTLGDERAARLVFTHKAEAILDSIRVASLGRVEVKPALDPDSLRTARRF
jgi:hypothetical protein